MTAVFDTNILVRYANPSSVQPARPFALSQPISRNPFALRQPGL